MNLGMIIIGTVLVAICALPFVAVGISKNKIKNRVKQSLLNLMKLNDASSTKDEFVGRMAIAIDENKRMLFYFKELGDRSESIVVKLNEMKSCKLDKESRTVSSDRGSYLLIESLTLRFLPIRKGAAEPKVVLFNIEDDLHLNDELQLADRWLKIIEEQIRLQLTVPVSTGQQPRTEFKATA